MMMNPNRFTLKLHDRRVRVERARGRVVRAASLTTPSIVSASSAAAGVRHEQAERDRSR